MTDGTAALDRLARAPAQSIPAAISDVPPPKANPTFYEFFAGGGMARAGLGPKWKCLFANDFDFKKSATYTLNWGEGQMLTKDVGLVELKDLPTATPDLVWASFPCQDLSLAGMGAGLRGDRSGTFWPFWKLMQRLRKDGRGPSLIVLENVCGTLTSHGGKDFQAIAQALSGDGYRFGAVVLDAADFVPQSRPRLFIIAVAGGVEIPPNLVSQEANPRIHTKALQAAHLGLDSKARSKWVWWKLSAPKVREKKFADLLEENPDSVSWHSPEETTRLLRMMSPINRKKVEDAKRSGTLQVGTIYKRTRLDEDEEKVQRAEVRFDDLAGCLRTPAGGSSRQLILVVNGNRIRSRLISTREAARLMGIKETYRLPENYNEAYHLVGDGVAVPVVRYLAANLLEPVLKYAHAEDQTLPTTHSVRKAPDAY